MADVKDRNGEQTLIVTIAAASAGDRLDRALATGLATQATAPSRSRIKALIAEGRVTSDGGTISDPSRRVKPGQVFSLTVPEATVPHAVAQPMPLTIVYEDSNLIVVDKPAGLVVHPAPGNPDRTLVNALLAHCGPSLAGIGGVARPGIVHRLDKDTSGLMVAAKTDAAHHALVEQFSNRSIERAYMALVWGVPRPQSGTFTGAIGRSPRDRKKMAVLRGGGRPAVTHYRVVKSLAGGRVSLVECRLATGRTHQIRVHLTTAGHPLLGDPVYGRSGAPRGTPPAVIAAIGNLDRQALDAVVLGFDHPRNQERLRFEKSISNDINVIISKLELM